MLDRGAGAFRLGPYDEMVPAARRYLPGSLMVETTWQTRTGWLIVRDALCMGPWHNVDERSRTHRRSPTDFDAEHCLLRIGALRQRLGRPVDDLRAGRSTTAGPSRRGSTTATGYGEVVGDRRRTATSTLRLTTDLRPGIEGAGAARPHPDGRGRQRTSSRCPGRRCRRRAPSTRPTERMRRTSEYWRQWITLGDFPDHPWRSYLQRSALTLKGLTYAPTGALLAAATTSLPETPQRRAQLGLPLRLGPRLDLRAVGALHPRLRPRGQRLLLLRRRRVPRRPRPAGDVRRRRRARARRGVAAAPVRLRGRLPGADRQRRRTTSASTTSGVRCSTRSTCTPGRASSCRSRCGRCSSGRSSRPPSTGRSRTAASGRCAASRSTSSRAS